MGLLIAGCGSNRNHEERRAYAEASGYIKNSCVNSCMDDTKGGPVDCAAAEEGIEFFGVDLLNFDRGKATNMFAYDDASDAFRNPPEGWEPPAVMFPEEPGSRIAQRCQRFEANGALHLQGGPFIGYGGGMGVSLAKLFDGNCAGNESDPEYCNPDAEFPTHEFDLTEWDGVSFWARRGPESQTVLRVGVSEKHTDTDLSYMATYNELEKTGRSTVKYCERFRECGCRNHKPCTLFEGQGEECMVCYDPETDDPPRSCQDIRAGGGRGDQDTNRGSGQYQACGETACDGINPSFDGNANFGQGADPQFNDKPCSEHYTRGGDFGMFCFDPKTDPAPPESNDRCGDSPFRPVRLTTEWQFFKVRFEDLAQQGWAKESFWMDIDKLTGVRFTFDRGWIDYWIDDLRFYREAR